MPWSKKLRLNYLILRELAHKYTRSLIFGFLVGLSASLLFWKIYPLFSTSVFIRTERIGIIGKYTPTNLPDSIASQISIGLTTLEPNGTPIHGLATSWEATNSGKTYIFTLDTSKRWHNGKHVTAHDINYNIRGATIIPDGNKQLTIHLQHAYSPFLSLVSKPIFLPGLMGLGPYEVKNIQIQGDTIKKLRINPTNDALLPSKLYSFYQTEAQAVEAFKLGEIDAIEEMSTPSALESWGSTEVIEQVKYNRVVSLFFNTQEPRLADKKIRQMLAFAIPLLAEEKATGPIPNTSWAYTENVKKYIFDEKTVNKMLSETPIATSDGELVISVSPSYLELAETIANSWNSFGIKSRVTVENSTPEQFQVLLGAQELPPDPDQYPLWHSTQTTTNISKYVNVKIDKLLEDARLETDQTIRQKHYVDFQRRLVDDVPAVFLYYPKTYTIRRK